MKVESNKLLKIIFYILILLTLFLICPFRASGLLSIGDLANKTTVSEYKTSLKYFYNTLYNPSDHIFSTNLFDCGATSCKANDLNDIGLLSLYEYNKIGGLNSYIDPYVPFYIRNGSSVNEVTNSGIKENTETSGMRPVIYLKEDTVVTGMGTVDDPYVISELSDLNIVGYTVDGNTSSNSFDYLLANNIVKNINCQKGTNATWNYESETMDVSDVVIGDSCVINFTSGNTISLSAGSTGTVTAPVSKTVKYNGTVTFTVTPNNGYENVLEENTCGGTLSGSTYTLTNVKKSAACKISFKKKTYALVLNVVNGTGSLNKTIDSEVVNFENVKPNNGYITSGASMSCDGGATISLSSSTVTISGVTKAQTCTVTFKPNVYTITLNNQSANSTGTTKVYYQYNTSKTVNGSTCYYFSDSSLTTCLSKISIPSKVGYGFGGYYTAASASGTQYIDASGNFKNDLYKTIGNKTLYASWSINSYAVMLNVVNGSGTTAKNVNYNGSTTITGVSPSSGYTASGATLTCDGGAKIDLTSSTVTISGVTNTQTCTVTFKPITYTITFNSQSADYAGTTKVYYQYNTSKTVNGSTCYYFSDSSLTTCLSKINNPTKKGYSFGGYYTSSNGSGISYVNPSGTFINDLYKTVGSKNLYANWKINSYQVTLTVINGYGSTTKNIDYNVNTTINGITPVNGYSASGASMSCNGGATITLNANAVTIGRVERVQTCTLTFKPITYTITLDNQSATSAGTTKVYYQYNTGKTINGSVCYYFSDSALTSCLSSISNPIKTGYSFGGYYTSTNGGGTQYINSSGTFINYLHLTTGNKTLYANWNINSYAVKLNVVNGSGSTSKNVNYNGSTTITGVSPNTGYTTSGASVKCDGGATISLSSSTVTISGVTKAQTCTLTFAEISSVVTLSAGVTGTVASPTSKVVKYNKTATFTVTPNSGYDNVLETNTCGGTLSGNTYTITNVKESKNCEISFRKNLSSLILTVINGTGGASKNVELGTGTFENVAPNAGYTTSGASMSCDGGATITLNSTTVTISGITKAQTCTLTFKPITYTITLDNQNATSAGTTKVYYQYNTSKTVNGSTCYYFSDSSLTTCLSKINNPTKTGYSFGGYYTSTSDGGTQYINSSGAFKNDLYKTIGNKTLYSKWALITYNIKLNVTNGIGGTTKSVNYGANASFTGVKPNAGYTTSGATLTCDGGATITLSSGTVMVSKITKSQTCTVTFPMITSTITLSAGSTGTVSAPSSKTINYNEDAVFTVTPNTGYENVLETNTCGGTLSGNTYTIANVKENKTCTITFKKITYNIKLNVSNGVGGTSKTVTYGTDASFTNVSPSTGYTATGATLTCDGGATASISGTTVTVSKITKSQTCSLTFPIITNTVTLSAGSTGTVSAPVSKVINYNENAVFTVTPNTGYENVLETNTCGGTLSGNTYTIANVKENKTCTIAFKKSTYTVTLKVAHGNGGGSQSVTYGTNATFKNVNAHTGYTATGATFTCDGGATGSISGTTVTISNIIKTQSCTLLFKSSTKLYDKLLADNPTITTRPRFDKMLTTTNTGTLYKSTESVSGAAEKTVYYFAGNAKNNWVYFGGIYWRIIRTNADGSIRMLYSGTGVNKQDGYIGTSAYNTNSNSPKYIGYMYGSADTTLEDARTNTYNSTIKTYIENWYKSKLTDYTKYLSTEAVYCNERQLASGYNWYYYKSPSDAIHFLAYSRLDGYYNNDVYPTYDCKVSQDAFSASNSSAKTTYPIGLMTYDEVTMAGGLYSTKLTSPYTWFFNNATDGTSITGNVSWWLLSPIMWNGSDSSISIFSVTTDLTGYILRSTTSSRLGVRPVVSLKACTLWETGNGSSSAPYKIFPTSSGC